MWTRLDPKYMMGCLQYKNKDNYDRVYLASTTNPKHKPLLRYQPGCFFVFSVATTYLKIKYSVHYRTKNQAYQPIKWGAEPILFGKLNGQWQLMNHFIMHIYKAGDIHCDNNPEHDEDFTLTFDLQNKKYSEFQICLPSQGRISEIAIETDTTPYFKYVKPSAVICGSSIAAGSSDSNAHSLYTMAYRLYGKNLINFGIPGCHTFNCQELMQKVLITKLPVIVMDLFHVKDNILKKYCIDKFKYLIVSPQIQKYEWCNIKPYKLEMANIDGDGHIDATHLNALGIKRYIEKLKKKGLI